MIDTNMLSDNYLFSGSNVGALLALHIFPIGMQQEYMPPLFVRIGEGNDAITGELFPFVNIDVTFELVLILFGQIDKDHPTFWTLLFRYSLGAKLEKCFPGDVMPRDLLKDDQSYINEIFQLSDIVLRCQA